MGYGRKPSEVLPPSPRLARTQAHGDPRVCVGRRATHVPPRLLPPGRADFCLRGSQAASCRRTCSRQRGGRMLRPLQAAWLRRKSLCCQSERRLLRLPEGMNHGRPAHGVQPRKRGSTNPLWRGPPSSDNDSRSGCCVRQTSRTTSPACQSHVHSRGGCGQGHVAMWPGPPGTAAVQAVCSAVSPRLRPSGALTTSTKRHGLNAAAQLQAQRA